MRLITRAPIDVHVGSKLKSLRDEYNLSQRRIGDIIGVTYQQVQKYESGACRLGPGAIFKLSQNLNVSPGYFFAGFHSPSEEKSPIDSEAELAQMVLLFSQIKNPLFRRELLERAQTYLKEE